MARRADPRQEILERAGIVYIDVSYEESVRKNRRRFRPELADSVLYHSLPDEKMEHYYRINDWESLAGDRHGAIHVKSLQVPFAVFDNEPERTDDPAKLGPALEDVFGRLWTARRGPLSKPQRHSREGSTELLLEFCAGYFVFYVLTGILAKYFTGGIREPNCPRSPTCSTTRSAELVALSVVLSAGWIRKPGRELWYIIPSGICTAVVIPTTTLMYTLPISVMVAMVIMRGSVIVISRIVDAVQIRQGILEEARLRRGEHAVVFALGAWRCAAVEAIQPDFGGSGDPGKGGFEFFQ